jgi:mutual gliding-motility protein MglA
MATISSINRECQLKLVYCGPSFGGKTTNVQQIHRSANPDRRGRLISLETDDERTLLFDMLPVKGGVIDGYAVRYHFYTVPGQQYYSAIRRGVLKGADGLVFVADSTPDRLEANRIAWQQLQEDTEAAGVDIVSTPLVLQYNKRDVVGALPADVLDAALNLESHPRFEAVATDGRGVFETLREVVRRAELNAKRVIRAEQEEPALP